MKKAITIFFVAVLTIPILIYAQDIPSSPRSREAITRVLPQLQKEFADSSLNFGAPIFIRIFKEERELEIWVRGKNRYHLLKTYPICTYGYGSLGPKTRQGDGLAPEGFYYVTPNRLNPVSNFHLSFNLGYPNRYDRIHGRTGSALMVHGSCVSIGCYAMTNKRIEEIYAISDAAFRNGQSFFRVHIFPFRMTEENMNSHSESNWYSFWENLKEGYDFFYKNDHIPPNVEVLNNRYIFEEKEQKKEEELEKQRQEELERQRKIEEQERIQEIKDRTRDALINARNNADNNVTGESETTGQGNQGSETGSINSDNHSPEPGGLGDVGLSYSLAGRTPKSLPNPEYNYQAEGVVVVEVTVDRNGNVTKATAGVKGSTTLDNYLLRVARKAALAAKFDKNPSAPAFQKGTIIYHFLLL
jgi:TonB family protein